MGGGGVGCFVIAPLQAKQRTASARELMPVGFRERRADSNCIGLI